AEDGIRDFHVTGVQTCALPIFRHRLLKLLTLRRNTRQVVPEIVELLLNLRVLRPIDDHQRLDPPHPRREHRSDLTTHRLLQPPPLPELRDHNLERRRQILPLGARLPASELLLSPRRTRLLKRRLRPNELLDR